MHFLIGIYPTLYITHRWLTYVYIQNILPESPHGSNELVQIDGFRSMDNFPSCIWTSQIIHEIEHGITPKMCLEDNASTRNYMYLIRWGNELVSKLVKMSMIHGQNTYLRCTYE